MGKHSIVWGAGFISERDVPKTPSVIHAVRGKLTRKKLTEAGIATPEVFGDPGMLCRRLYDKKVPVRFTYGIIPHYVHKKHPWLAENASDDLLVIDIEAGFESTIDQVRSCCHILSSSLHGLVIAEAYDIPCTWIEFDGQQKLCGGRFKFFDLFSGLGKQVAEPLVMGSGFQLSTWKPEKVSRTWGRDNEKQLLGACPLLSGGL
jgi:pyruvyltransferase